MDKNSSMLTWLSSKLQHADMAKFNFLFESCLEVFSNGFSQLYCLTFGIEGSLWSTGCKI